MGSLGVEIGRIVECDTSGRVLLDCGDSVPKLARVVADLTDEQLTAAVERGQEALIAYPNGDPDRPIVIGLLRPPDAPARQAAPLTATIDDETISLEAKKQIVLKCGKASITLTRAGKVLIRGAYVLTRSSGVNRVKGGSVQIN
ncbi:MAG: hypothetical protein A2Y76_11190 [Planctomycetes bacterium RBG_13_60_9]|nr:MAG: hypothetical protein A2Y76_11190 [Planctomycetes bacterium RBG_13_60_9]